MDFITFMNTLSALSFEQKLLVAYGLKESIAKDKMIQSIKGKGDKEADALIAIIGDDGGKPIAQHPGRPIDPDSKASKIRSMLFPYLESKGGTERTKNIMKYMAGILPKVTQGEIYNATAQFVKQGTLTRGGGVWSLTSGVRQSA